jgi:hypothetical protein
LAELFGALSSHGRDAVQGAVTRLFALGLIEIRKNNVPQRLDQIGRLWYEPLDNCQVKLTPAAQGLSQELGLRLDGSQPLFGVPPPRPSNAPPLLFVVMPFGKNLGLGPVERVIRKTGVARGLEVQRGDDVYTVNVFMEDVWASIYQARLVVAECTGRNANVFYEIGLAHGAGRPVILLTQAIGDIPSDLQHRRVVAYTNTPAGRAELARKLDQTLATVLAES